MKKQLQNVQALRGVAVILVLLYHILTVEKKYNPDFVILPKLFKLGGIGVDFFFIISGFIMYYVTEKYHQKLSSFFVFLYSRFTRIYPIYWFYSILILPVLFLKPSWVNSSQGGEVNLLASFLLYPTNTKPLIIVAWSLIHEIYFYLMYAFFLLLFKRKQIWFFCCGWLFIIFCANAFNITTNPFASVVFNTLTIEFIMGLLLGVTFKKDNLKTSKIHKNILLSTFIIFPLIFYTFFHFFENEDYRYLKFGIPCLIMIYVALVLENKNLIFHSLLIKIGNASYSIYLVHILVINVVGKALGVFGLSNFFYECLLVLLMFVFSILTGVLSYKFLEMRLIMFFKKHNFTKKLNFDRYKNL